MDGACRHPPIQIDLDNLDALRILPRIPRLRGLELRDLGITYTTDVSARWISPLLSELTSLDLTKIDMHLVMALITASPSLRHLRLIECSLCDDDWVAIWQAPIIRLTKLFVGYKWCFTPPAPFLAKLMQTSSATLQSATLDGNFHAVTGEAEMKWLSGWLPIRLPAMSKLALRCVSQPACKMVLASTGPALWHLTLVNPVPYDKDCLAHLPTSLRVLLLQHTTMFGGDYPLSQTANDVVELLNRWPVWLPSLTIYPHLYVHEDPFRYQKSRKQLQEMVRIAWIQRSVAAKEQPRAMYFETEQ
ncbi:hypothetical protein EMMF5_002273 [Cystobasidiomycetes sp. EMM_F5]